MKENWIKQTLIKFWEQHILTKMVCEKKTEAMRTKKKGVKMCKIQKREKSILDFFLFWKYAQIIYPPPPTRNPLAPDFRCPNVLPRCIIWGLSPTLHDRHGDCPGNVMLVGGVWRCTACECLHVWVRLLRGQSAMRFIKDMPPDKRICTMKPIGSVCVYILLHLTLGLRNRRFSGTLKFLPKW